MSGNEPEYAERYALSARVSELESALISEKQKKRPWSDEHTKNVIESQVKEIDRLHKLLAQRNP